MEGSSEKGRPMAGQGAGKGRSGGGPAEPAKPSKGKSALFCFILLYLQLIEHSQHTQALRGAPNSSATRIPPGQLHASKTQKNNQDF